jgi:FrmR/RcnR family transcriptional regulator, repressor of frmRAB operon
MHTIKDKDRLIARVRRIRGQVEALERALESEAGCEAAMHQIAGIRGALAGLTCEVVEDHIHSHLVDPDKHPGVLDEGAAADLMSVLRSYLK